MGGMRGDMTPRSGRHVKCAKISHVSSHRIALIGCRPLVLVASLLPVACVSEASTRVRVEPSPQSGAVVFVLEDRTLFYGLTVMTCEGRATWTMSNQRLGAPPPRITYGVAPDGFVTRTGPAPLGPGCYDVIVSGPSRTRFHIGEDGRLVTDADSS